MLPLLTHMSLTSESTPVWLAPATDWLTQFLPRSQLTLILDAFYFSPYLTTYLPTGVELEIASQLSFTTFPKLSFFLSLIFAGFSSPTRQFNPKLLYTDDSQIWWPAHISSGPRAQTCWWYISTWLSHRVLELNISSTESIFPHLNLLLFQYITFMYYKFCPHLPWEMYFYLIFRNFFSLCILKFLLMV